MGLNGAVALVVDAACETGEGPLWHPDEGRLYWLDIPAGRLLRHDPRAGAGRFEEVYRGEPIGGLTLQPDGALLLFMARGAVRVWREGRPLETVIAELPEERDSRFNDAIADPEGRVFCGTMSVKDAAGAVVRPGRLYRLERDGRIRVVLDGLGTPNGMGFTPDGLSLYFTDTAVGTQTIYLFDYDRATGAITNQRRFLQTPLDLSEGRPDGMTVDADGFIWSARWGGGMVARVSPRGDVVARFPVPARNVSSVTFGGEAYADLYITTAGANDRDALGPGAGALFRLTTGIRGVPEFRSRIG